MKLVSINWKTKDVYYYHNDNIQCKSTIYIENFTQPKLYDV